MWGQQQQQQQVQQQPGPGGMSNAMMANLMAMRGGGMGAQNMMNIQQGLGGNAVPLPSNEQMARMQNMQNMQQMQGIMPGMNYQQQYGGGMPGMMPGNAGGVPPPPMPGDTGLGGGPGGLPQIPNDEPPSDNVLNENFSSSNLPKLPPPIPAGMQDNKVKPNNQQMGIPPPYKAGGGLPVPAPGEGEGSSNDQNAPMMQMNQRLPGMMNQQMMGNNMMMNQQQQMMNQQQMMQMKQQMENQVKRTSPRAGTAASANALVGSNPLYKDHTSILMALKLFGCEDPKQWEKYVQNFKKHKQTDHTLHNIDCCDLKLFHKLIPDNDLLRHRLLSWIKYDMQDAHGLHDSTDEKSNKNNKNNRVINLNVSGRVFSCLKSTLTKTGSSFFEKITRDEVLENNSKCRFHVDNNGAYFINRDEDLFAVILKYLRSDKLCYDASCMTLEDIQGEFRYYDVQFPGIFDRSLPIEFRLEYCSSYDAKEVFFANQFRVLPKSVQPSLMMYFNIPREFKHPDQFFEWKEKFPKLIGYQLCEQQQFCGDQWIWTYVEVYKRCVWNEQLKVVKK